MKVHLISNKKGKNIMESSGESVRFSSSVSSRDFILLFFFTFYTLLILRSFCILLHLMFTVSFFPTLWGLNEAHLFLIFLVQSNIELFFFKKTLIWLQTQFLPFPKNVQIKLNQNWKHCETYTPLLVLHWWAMDQYSLIYIKRHGAGRWDLGAFVFCSVTVV